MPKKQKGGVDRNFLDGIKLASKATAAAPALLYMDQVACGRLLRRRVAFAFQLVGRKTNRNNNNAVKLNSLLGTGLDPMSRNAKGQTLYQAARKAKSGWAQSLLRGRTATT